MKWYLVRNQSHDPLTIHDLLDEAAKGNYRIKGHRSGRSSEDDINLYKEIATFNPHEDQIIRILSKRDRGKGVVCKKGLKIGKHGSFLIKQIDSPRNIWTKSTKPANEL